MTLAEHALVTAEYAAAPAPARGMASYNLACALARAGRLDEAAEALAGAIALNPDIRVNAGHDKDLAGVRKAERIAVLLGG